jgi:hypothetical protein
MWKIRIMKRIFVHQALVITRREFDFSVVRHIRISLRTPPPPNLGSSRFPRAAPNGQRRDSSLRTVLPLYPRWRATPEATIRIGRNSGPEPSAPLASLK